MTAFAEEKRSHYAITLIPVRLLADLGLTVQPAPIAAVAGHVVVPEINIDDYSADRANFATIKLRLAETASENIIRRPVDAGSA